MPDVVRAMHNEMEEQRDFLNDKSLKTIYFGGGTPSLLQPEEFSRFIDHADKLFDCHQVEELTIEANPDDIDKKYVEELRHTAVNRVSLGVQAFNDAELKFMNRRHSAVQAEDAVKRLQDAGFENITIDLIFGVAGFDEQVLLESLSKTLMLGAKHVSAYHLTIEPQTVFGRKARRGELIEISEEQSQREYDLVERVLTAAGYEHYEVSNYALDGYRSKHNSSYWHGAEYLGVGAGAHSFNTASRHWAQLSIKEYITQRRYDSEELSVSDRYNEHLMTNLRCIEGINIEQISSIYGKDKGDKLLLLSKPWIESEKLIFEGGNLRIPTCHFLLSDAIISSLFEV